MSHLLWDPGLESRLSARLTSALTGDLTQFADLPPAAEAWVVHVIARRSGNTVLWVADDARTLESRSRDFQVLSPPGALPPLLFPSWEVLPSKTIDSPDPGIIGARMECLSALAEDKPRLIVTCAQALMEATLSPAAFNACSRIMRTGDECDLSDLVSMLEQSGYRFVTEVQSPGEVARRGGILDVWPLSTPQPLRLEFFGSLLESIREFDPIEQQSTVTRDQAVLTPAGEWKLIPSKSGNAASLLSHIPPGNMIVVWSDLESIRQHADIYEETAREATAGPLVGRLAEIEAALAMRPSTRQYFVGSGPDSCQPAVDLGFRSIDPMPSVTARHSLHPDFIESSRRAFLTSVISGIRTGIQTCFCFDSLGTQDRFHEAYGGLFGELAPMLALTALSGGFSNPSLGLLVVAEPDLYGRKIQRRQVRPHNIEARRGGVRISDWTDMEPGNLVVHIDHGVGRYLGLREIMVAGQLQEALAIEYAEGARLYVPVSQAHLLTRYVGVGRRSVALHKLGGKRWDREKGAAEHAVQDLAGTLLDIQASRDSQDGFPFPPDTPWQHELEAAFPFEETVDQASAIQEVKTDMERQRPMDRLLCGDAGYGKTEVAIRAAFKAVMAGKQVAVLVPTTVLAQQHFQTFSERMAPFPVRIEMLSRFCTRAECGLVAKGLADGTVDIVIGTHALLQPDLSFKNLGLVIIDEEQKFGVLHKERFKHIRRLVDVLTLTATPIPRTLYMSLTGARDLSTIQTPPQERLAVETLVMPDADAVIREAILRELNRGGQVFFLHNRVRSIDRLRDRIQGLVPEARLGVGHGQMPAGMLADIMRQFAAGEFDVLLCTTIIESGLDIPNANTIIIDRADRFGLSELYQLRGRVGRAKHKAYAYMLLPGQAHIDPTARKRIQAIKQYSGAGSGFRLAMRDLEIRGAGNLLGADQSGHIAAVGFGLYCQLLRHTIAKRKGDPLPPVIDVDITLDFISLSPSDAGAEHSAIIPLAYVDDERLRVSLYRRIAETAYVKEVQSLRRTFRDRFGPLPPECERLLKLAEIRILAATRNIQSVQVEEGKIMLMRQGEYIMTQGRFARLSSSSPDARLDELRRHLRHD